MDAAAPPAKARRAGLAAGEGALARHAQPFRAPPLAGIVFTTYGGGFYGTNEGGGQPDHPKAVFELEQRGRDRPVPPA